ncbi:MAG: PilN domain-containing protein [Phycisphaeraceae bacterium]
MQQQPINFLPASYRRRVRRRNTMMRQLALLGMLALLLVVWWVGQGQQTAALRRYANELEGNVHMARDQMSEVAQLRDQYKHLRHQMRVQQILAAPLRHTQILATLGREVPDSVTLTDLSMRTERAAPEAVLIADGEEQAMSRHHEVHLTLTALAPEDMVVANMLSALKRHALFSDAAIQYSRTVERYDVSAREFQMRVTVDLDREFVVADDALVERSNHDD